MDLEQYIKDNYGSKRAFAKAINTSRTQVSRYIKMRCKWFEGNVWQNKTNLTNLVVAEKEFDIESFEADDMVVFYVDSDNNLEFDGFDESYVLRLESAIAIAKHFKLI